MVVKLGHFNISDIWSIMGYLASCLPPGRGLLDESVEMEKYFTPNCDITDSELVNRFMKAKELEGYLNRVIKTEEGGKVVYEIREGLSQPNFPRSCMGTFPIFQVPIVQV